MRDGFLHAAAVSPGLRVADVPYNKAEILAAMQKAAAEGVKLLCLVLVALGLANMWLAIFADVGVMILAVLNAIRALFVKHL